MKREVIFEDGSKGLYDRNVLQIKVDLLAGVQQNRQLPGEFLHLYSSAGELDVEFDDGETVTIREGSLIERAPFRRVSFLSAIDQSITVKYGFGLYRELTANISIDSSATLITTDEQNGVIVSTSDATIAAGATVTILAANNDRRNTLVKSLQANAGTLPLRVGSTGTGATTGHELGPGESWATNSSAAIIVHNPSAVSQGVSIQHEELT